MADVLTAAQSDLHNCAATLRIIVRDLEGWRQNSETPANWPPIDDVSDALDLIQEKLGHIANAIDEAELERAGARKPTV